MRTVLRQTKSEIRAEALRLFVEKGVTETSTRDIARAVGIADSAMYRHYASKDDLVWDLFSTGYSAYARRLRDLADATEGLRAKIDAIVRGVSALFDEDPTTFRFLLLTQHGQLEKVQVDADNPVEILRQVIAEGMERGEIPARDPNLAAAWVMGIVLQPATFKTYGRIDRPFAELADELSAACWRVLQA